MRNAGNKNLLNDQFHCTSSLVHVTSTTPHGPAPQGEPDYVYRPDNNWELSQRETTTRPLTPISTQHSNILNPSRKRQCHLSRQQYPDMPLFKTARGTTITLISTTLHHLLPSCKLNVHTPFNPHHKHKNKQNKTTTRIANITSHFPPPPHPYPRTVTHSSSSNSSTRGAI